MRAHAEKDEPPTLDCGSAKTQASPHGRTCLPTHFGEGQASHDFAQLDFMKPGFFLHSPPFAQFSQLASASLAFEHGGSRGTSLSKAFDASFRSRPHSVVISVGEVPGRRV